MAIEIKTKNIPKNVQQMAKKERKRKMEWSLLGTFGKSKHPVSTIHPLPCSIRREIKWNWNEMEANEWEKCCHFLWSIPLVDVYTLGFSSFQSLSKSSFTLSLHTHAHTIAHIYLLFSASFILCLSIVCLSSFIFCFLSFVSLLSFIFLFNLAFPLCVAGCYVMVPFRFVSFSAGCECDMCTIVCV